MEKYDDYKDIIYPKWGECYLGIVLGEHDDRHVLYHFINEGVSIPPALQLDAVLQAQPDGVSVRLSKRTLKLTWRGLVGGRKRVLVFDRGVERWSYPSGDDLVTPRDYLVIPDLIMGEDGVRGLKVSFSLPPQPFGLEKGVPEVINNLLRGEERVFMFSRTMNMTSVLLEDPWSKEKNVKGAWILY